MVEEKTGELKQLFVYEHDAKRLELFIRIVYSFVIGLVLMVYGFIAEICMLIQWFVILILGRRSEGLSNFIKGYLEYYVHVVSYIYWMTDDRPGILPKPVEIYEKE
ncbi:MAG: DUF4389 domain-containing protein [Methanophagales archaeon]|jgi:hypothetical protein|nr:DUF4389 domain-containing protein [Methanophagales archaeon]